MDNLGHMNLDSFARMIREHQAGIRAYICSLGASFDYVDDIAQESFLIAWKKRSSYDPLRDFGTWVRGIARNVMLRKRAADRRNPRIVANELSEALAELSTEDEPMSAEDSRRLIMALNECVSMLPPRSEALLRERYEDNVSASQLARRFGKSGDAVRQAFARIRARLRECIQERFGEAVL